MLFFFIIQTEDGKTIIHQIYIDLRPEMQHVAYKILDDQTEAEDAVQDAFVKIIRNLDSFLALDENYRIGYCICAVRSVSIDKYRHRKVMARNVVRLEEYDYMLKDETADIEEMSIKREQVSDMVESIEELEPEYKNPLLLHFVKEMPYKDIAEALNINEALARKRVQRAIEKIAKPLKKGGHVHA